MRVFHRRFLSPTGDSFLEGRSNLFHRLLGHRAIYVASITDATPRRSKQIAREIKKYFASFLKLRVKPPKRSIMLWAEARLYAAISSQAHGNRNMLKKISMEVVEPEYRARAEAIIPVL